MAVYVSSRKETIDPGKERGSGKITEFMVDDVSDIANLPTKDSMKGSTAFVINTGTAYALGSNGWRQI